ncbi:MAG TPA: MBL fold metallo-hydrolase [Gemmatimonadales bacterium]
MTTLVALGSGSGGNAFAVVADDAVLLIDAGFSAREVTRRAALAGVDLDRLCGIALTHEHGDHARGALRLAVAHRVPMLASAGTWAALGATTGVRHLPLRPGGRAECGPFTVAGCELLHDAAEPLALTITTPAGERLGVAYDFGRPTQALRYHFRELTALVVEANYDEVMLRTSQYPISVQARIAGSGGHLSNSATARLLEELFHPGLGTVVLAHLSRSCNTPEAARAAVEPTLRARGFAGMLAVALQHEPLPPIALGAAPELPFPSDSLEIRQAAPHGTA